MKYYSLFLLFICFSLLFSCKTGLKPTEVSAGEADFSTYVAVGNSLTAGYQDGALCKEGQASSYPVLLSQQFALVGGGEFKVPYMDDGSGNDGDNNPRLRLAFTLPCNSTTPTISPILDGIATPFNNVSAGGPYNLIGVPGVRAIDCNLGLYSNASFGNPFLARFCEHPGVSTLITEATRKKPTFFSFWLGSNDALLYSVRGAVDNGGSSLSDTAVFRFNMELAIDSLTAHGAKGVMANVPDITTVPYFTTIPWNGILLDSAEAAQLNAQFLGTGITWHTGNNGFLVVDSSVTNYMRHATSEELILLSTPSDSIACGKWGTNVPLKDANFLDAAEVHQIQTRISEYNEIISSIASKKNLALADMNAYLKTLQPGMIYNGLTMNAKYVSGGVFSLDGVHPNRRGYALIANVFIRAINSKYKSTIPEVDVTAYPGVMLP